MRELSTRPGNREIVSAIIALGQRLGLSIIAEGVETKAQLEYLSSQGCSHIQGYLFSRPLAADAFAKFLTTSTVVPLHSQILIPA